MEPTFIKIRKGSRQKVADPNAINLAQSNRPTQKTPDKKRWLILLLMIIVLAEASWLAFLLFIKTAPPYQSLIPKNTVSFTYFNQSQLKELTSSLKNQNYQWPFSTDAPEILGQFLSKNGLNLDAISSLFKNQIALIILDDNQPPLKWLVIAEKNAQDQEFTGQLNQAEKNLKQNFNLSSDSYRQIKISQIKRLDQNPNSFYYVQISDYFLLSNHLDTLKSTIDKIIR